MSSGTLPPSSASTMSLVCRQRVAADVTSTSGVQPDLPHFVSDEGGFLTAGRVELAPLVAFARPRGGRLRMAQEIEAGGAGWHEGLAPWCLARQSGRPRRAAFPVAARLQNVAG